jgi:hypothetical protein
VRRGWFAAAGPSRYCGPRRLSGVVVRPLNFTVRRQKQGSAAFGRRAVVLREVLQSFDHPGLLLAASVLALISVPALARFFFGSFAELKRDLGLDDELGRQLWLFGLLPSTPSLYFAAIAFLGCYVIVVLLVYSLLSHAAGWLR